MADTGLIPSSDEMGTYQLMAKHAANSGFFKNIGGEGGLLSIVLYARELGLPPMQCLFGGMRNIKGNIELSPRLMNSMIRKAGHKLQIIKCDNFICTIKGTRSDTGETYESTFTMDDAKQANLLIGGSAWTKHPSDMLFKSALSRIARRLFPDVIATAYVEGEIPGDDQIIDTGKSMSKTEVIETIQIEEAKPAESPVVAESASPVVESEPGLSKDQARIVEKLIGEDGDLFVRILDGYKVSNLQNIPAKHFDTICSTLKKRKDPKEK